MIYPAWLAVFAWNLFVPLPLGLGVLKHGGRIGLSIAIALLVASGCYFCIASQRIGRVLVAGGIFIALTQSFPILQFLAGTIGLFLAAKFASVEQGGTTESAGFVATLVTGAILIGLSLGIGLVLRRITPTRWWGSNGKNDTTPPGALNAL
jgi:hypothetical protein